VASLTEDLLFFLLFFPARPVEWGHQHKLQMLRVVGAAVAVGVVVAAGVKLARKIKDREDTKECRRTVKAVHTQQRNASLDAKLIERDSAMDWGSPIHPLLPQNHDGSRTWTPSKLPRPRRLFSEDSRTDEVSECC
jgi:hypothetical protein